MDLKIALIGKSYGWVQILKQIGIKFDLLVDTSTNQLFQYPVIVLSESASNHDIIQAKKYVETGGSLLCSTKIFYQNNSVKNLKERYVKFLLTDRDGYFNIGEFIDLWRNIVYLDYAEHLKSNIEEFTLTEMNYGDGKVILLPFDAGSLYDDHSYKHKSFYSYKSRLPHERVAKVSKGPVRKIVSNSLEYLFHSQNLLYCHKWYFPATEKNVFLFRVDTDYGKFQNISDLYQLALEHNIPITWFIDVKSQKDILEFYTKIQNQELALHCFEHREFKNAGEYKSDLATAIEYLHKYEIYPEGFAAVYGKWNREISNVIKDFDFEYSSEFCFDYDNLPSFDENENLQIPVHPICVGSLRRQGHSASDMIRYFELITQKKINNQEPLIFYHHPNDENIEVVHYLFNKIKNLQIPAYSFLSYAKWWKNRVEVDYSARFENKSLEVEFKESNKCALRITNKENQETFISNSGSYDISQLKWQMKPVPSELPRDFNKIYKMNIWKIINKLEDMI